MVGKGGGQGKGEGLPSIKVRAYCVEGKEKFWERGGEPDAASAALREGEGSVFGKGGNRWKETARGSQCKNDRM